MWILADARGRLVAWADAPERLPRAPIGSTVREIPEFAAPPPDPYVWTPAALTWTVPPERVPNRPALSKLSFQWRFTLEEQRALRRIEREHPVAQVRDDLAIMRESLMNVTDPLGVDVTDVRTQLGAALMVDVLVADGLIDPAQRNARLMQVLAP